MARSEISQFEQLVADNKEAFLVMLEGALKDWYGAYNVLLTDTKQYLLDATKSETYNPLCAKIQEVPEGQRLCQELDEWATREAQTRRNPILYPCHQTGLQDAAIPVIVRDELIAVIFCGQIRLIDPDWDALGFEEVQKTERNLGLPSCELTKLYRNTPQVPIEQLEEAAQRIFAMSNFLSRIFETHLDLQDKHAELQRVQDEQAHQRERDKEIDEAVAELFALSRTENDLWQKLEGVLQQVVRILGANCGAFLLHHISEDSARTTKAQLTVNMPKSIKRKDSYQHDDLFDNWTNLEDVQRRTFDVSNPGTLCRHLAESRLASDPPLHTTVTVRVHLAEKIKGLMVFLFEEEGAATFDLDRERASLRLIARRMEQSYRNTRDYRAQGIEEEARRKWLKRVSHQIIAPLNGLIGHAESLLTRSEYPRRERLAWFSTRPEEELTHWYNALDSILWTANWAARLTRNLAWVADLGRHQRPADIDFEIIKDVPGFLIECARFMQGAARARGLRKVHVDTDSVAGMNGRLRIYSEYFRQAVLNLLDNAVKYSNRGTEIIMGGEATNGHGRIWITNYGIPILEEDSERIFAEGERTSHARRCYPTGTGIGLTIAREIVELHGGRLTVAPSKETDEGWRTTFTISLPLEKQKTK